jgi:two-component system LytT family response regulator
MKIPIYIIEDDLENLLLLKILLNKCYPELTVIGVAQDILEMNKLLLQDEAEIIFLDIELKDGYLSLEELGPFKHLKHKIITTTSSQRLSKKAKDEFAIEHNLLKPLELNALKTSIIKILENRLQL